MPRKPRYYLSGVPCHVILRGHNQAPCFFSDRDRRVYLDWLREASARYECAVHAYVLMTNHVHLLVTPRWVGSISLTLQAVGRQYVRYVNASLGRTGTLWEGRHKACLVDSERYFLTCSRYIELNPVRAGMVKGPGDYRWSSYGRNAAGLSDPLITEHGLYTSLGQTAAERQQAYFELVSENLDESEIEAIRDATNLCVPLGNDRFRLTVEAQLMRKVSYLRPGRPRRPAQIPPSDQT
jgi:putative transposase